MSEQLPVCIDDQRRARVREAELNGIDYVEVSDDQKVLTVFFLGKAPARVHPENVVIEGGRRVRNVRVIGVDACVNPDSQRDDCMKIHVDCPGDASTYTLRFVEAEEGRPTKRRLTGFDRRYAQVDFSFKAGCPSDLDCAPERVCPPEQRAEPEISYLAKDYASFRQLILDRLSLIMPEWQERHVADLGIALVELLAYVGDRLSYYQDAVATDAYLETARQRISVRRHARLVDYRMHEGCNARAFVCVETSSDYPLELGGVKFITGPDAAGGATVLTREQLDALPFSEHEVFEPMQDGTAHLYQARNSMSFYTWGNAECCLPAGATSATLIARPPRPPAPGPAVLTHVVAPEPAPGGQADPALTLHLKCGDILIFEEVKGPETGNPADADPAHRQAVRLTSVTAGEDELLHQPVVEIEWAPEDALRFRLCLSSMGPAPECELIEGISVARGNVILVDHGRTIEHEKLGTVAEPESPLCCEELGEPFEQEEISQRDFRPVLRGAPLTFSEPLAACLPASRVLAQDPRAAQPWLRVAGVLATPAGDAKTHWEARADLLGSGGEDRHVVAEIDNDGHAHVRFGDGDLGRAPEAGMGMEATYRIGVGPAGNVGAEAISRIVLPGLLDGVTLRARNPLPAAGGTAPEPVDEARLFAPFAIRKDLQRAITAADYAAVARKSAAMQTRLQGAAAALRWTGSWYEVLVAVDPTGAEEASTDLLETVEGELYRYRRMGHDLRVAGASYVPIRLAMTVCVLPHYLRGDVEAELLEVFGSRRLAGGRLGFFHPDSLTFGEGVYLSAIVAAAQAVPGVESVTVTALERQFEGPNGEIDVGVLRLGPLEVAWLDNDARFPDRGVLVLDMRGGR